MSGIRSYVSGMSLLLLGLSMLLGVLFFAQWNTDIAENYARSDSGANKEPADYELTSVLPFQPSPYTSLGEILERPLFTEGRIPPEKPDKTPKAVSRMQPLKLKLEGVVISPESKVAIITDLMTRELLRLSQGMSHANWKVTEVSEGAVTIQQGAREIVLTLEIDGAAGAVEKRPKIPFKLPPTAPVRR